MAAKTAAQIKKSEVYSAAVQVFGSEVADKAARIAEVNEEPFMVALDELTDKLGIS